MLEKYNEIIFWQKDKRLSYQLAKKLNSNRCSMISLVRSSYESLVLNEEFEKRVKTAKFSLKENTILKFPEIKSAIKDEVLNDDLYTGIPVCI